MQGPSFLNKLKRSFTNHYQMEVEEILPDKENKLFLIRTKQAEYMMKINPSAEKLNWQIQLLEQLQQRKVLGLVYFLKNRYNSYLNQIWDEPLFYTIMPYIRGKQISPQNMTDMRACIRLLAYFHQHGSGIYGKKQQIPVHFSIYSKWESKLKQFQESLDQFKAGQYQRESVMAIVQRLAPDVLEWASWSLSQFPRQYLSFLEEKAQWERQLAHLDVAAHNFLVGEGKDYYLLDYDLVDYAPPYLDIIQFLNRNMYHYHWSYSFVEQMLVDYQYHFSISADDYKFLPILLVFPHDFIREWLGVWKHKRGYHPQNVLQYYQQLEQSWSLRIEFVKRCQRMVKT